MEGLRRILIGKGLNTQATLRKAQKNGAFEDSKRRNSPDHFA